MPGSTRLRTISIIASWLLLSCLSTSAVAQIRFDLPAQSLAQALTAVGSLGNVNVLFDARQVDGLQAPALKAEVSADDALARLLSGTQLRAVRVDEHTVRVIAEPAATPQSVTRVPGSVHLAYAGESPRAGAGRSNSENESFEHLEQVIVTAQKREERLQDVPVPVTAISAETLVQSGQTRLQDYYSSIPGLNVSPNGTVGVQQALVVRGLSSGISTNPTVGVTVDDVPFGNSSGNFGGNVVPDLDPSDLARVEVLRGPQGTLYGASSLGGLLKFVTVDPSTEALTGRLQADGNAVYNGAEAGYGFRGAVNVPLTETSAVRASAFTRQDPGYIDNPVLHLDGVNRARVSGGRVSAIWRPSDVFSAKVSALYQQTKADGINEVDVLPGLGDLEQNYNPQCCAYEKKLQAYSAIVNAKLGNVDLTSVSGYNVNTFSNAIDYGYGFGIPSVSLPSGRTRKFTQEMRASVSLGPMVEWLVGGFYTHEDIAYGVNVAAVDPTSGALAASLLAYPSIPNKYTEYAGFTDLTVHFTDRFDVQIGGRESHIEQVAEPFTATIFGSTFEYPKGDDTATAFTYLVTPQMKISPDLMAYVRIASGYRPGASNNYNFDPLVPRAATPDKTRNYEIGIKGDVLDHVLTFDASLYYIDWQNIQIVLSDTNEGPNKGAVYTTNGSAAKSEGVELSVEIRPLIGMTMAGWVAYDNAVLTKDMPPDSTVSASSGSRLPYGSRLSGNLSLDQTFPLVRGVTGSAGAQMSYIGERLGTFIPFDPTTPRASYPAYVKVDLRASAMFGSWSTNLYVNNVGDRRGLLGGGAGAAPPYAYYQIQPRTVGLSLVKTF